MTTATLSSWSVRHHARSLGRDQSGGSTVQTAVLANDPVLGDDIRGGARPDDLDGRRYLAFHLLRRCACPDRSQSVIQCPASGRWRCSRGFLAFCSFRWLIRSGQSEFRAWRATSYLPATYPIGAILNSVDSRAASCMWSYEKDCNRFRPRRRTSFATAARRTDDIGTESVSPAVVSSALPCICRGSLPSDVPDSSAPNKTTWSAVWQRANAAVQAVVCSSGCLAAGRCATGRLATADGGGPGLDDVSQTRIREYVQSTGLSRTAMRRVSLLRQRWRSAVPSVTDQRQRWVSSVCKARGQHGCPSGRRDAIAAGWAGYRQAAMIAHDGIAADPDGSTIAPPKSFTDPQLTENV